MTGLNDLASVWQPFRQEKRSALKPGRFCVRFEIHPRINLEAW
jgi:hypothetical protein